MGWNPFKKSSWKKVGDGFKKAGKDIAKAAKATAKGIADAGKWTADTLGKGVEFVADKAGDIAQGVGKGLTAVTGIKAFEKAGNSVNNFTDNNLGPAMSRALTAPIKALTGMPQQIMEKGLIDGIVHQGAEFVQDGIGSTARLVGGKKAEAKVDKWYDEKAQKWIEMAGGVAGRVALALVPGGQAVLMADVASEVGSLGYRAGNGEKLEWYDYIDAGMGIVTGGGGSAALKGVAQTAIKETGETVAKETGKAAAKETGKAAAKETAKVTTTETAKATATEATTAAATETAKATATELTTTAATETAKATAKSTTVEATKTAAAETGEAAASSAAKTAAAESGEAAATNTTKTGLWNSFKDGIGNPVKGFREFSNGTNTWRTLANNSAVRKAALKEGVKDMSIEAGIMIAFEQGMKYFAPPGAAPNPGDLGSVGAGSNFSTSSTSYDSSVGSYGAPTMSSYFDVPSGSYSYGRY